MKTSIDVSIKNKERLKALGRMGDSYDDVIGRLLGLETKMPEKKEKPAQKPKRKKNINWGGGSRKASGGLHSGKEG